MAFDNRDSIDFGKEKIPHLFNALFIPTLLGMIFDVTFILADGIFVGHGVGPDGLASVNLAGPVMMVITGIAMMFGVGGSVVAAIHLSKDNVKAARIVVTQAFVGSGGIALAFAAMLYAAPEFFLRLLGTSAELMPMVKDYLLWIIPTCLLLMIQIVGSFVIRLDGSPKYSMMANIIPSLLNIGLDYLFIFPLGMGLVGAALATTIGIGVGAAMTLLYVFRFAGKLKFYKLKRTRTAIRLGLRNIGYMMKLGFSSFLGEFGSSVMQLSGNIMFGKLIGDIGIAAFSVVCYLMPVLLNIFYAVSSSAQPIMSYNFGAEQPDRVRDTYKFSLFVCVTFSLCVTAFAATFSPSIASVFLPSGSEAFGIVSEGLPLFSACFALMGFNIATIGFFQSTKQALTATILVSLRGFILLVAAFLTLPSLLGLPGLWLACPAAEALTALVALALLFFRKRKFQNN